jgi:hypothetical protein
MCSINPGSLVDDLLPKNPRIGKFGNVFGCGGHNCSQAERRGKKELWRARSRKSKNLTANSLSYIVKL